MENGKSNLGFWALLALLAGGGIFAATKLFGNNKNSKNNIPTGDSSSTNSTINHTISSPSATFNAATKAGYPFSIDTSKISYVAGSIPDKDSWGHIIFQDGGQYSAIINGVTKVFVVVYYNGVYYLSNGKSLLSNWYGYGVDGLFIDTSVDPTKLYTANHNGTCFKEDAIVTLADGKKKKIKDIRRGDVLLGVNNVNNTVEHITVHHGAIGSSLYGFNGSQPFVTKDHPFLTTDGWKSISPKDAQKARPEMKELLNNAIKEGDEISIVNNRKFPISSIDEYTLTEDIKLYDICVGGNNTFIVYDMFVHNKKFIATKS